MIILVTKSSWELELPLLKTQKQKQINFYTFIEITFYSLQKLTIYKPPSHLVNISPFNL